MQSYDVLLEWFSGQASVNASESKYLHIDLPLVLTSGKVVGSFESTIFANIVMGIHFSEDLTQAVVQMYNGGGAKRTLIIAGIAVGY